jgi:hypothetical protein
VVKEKLMLSIQYPTAYQDVFAPLIDFEVIDASLWKRGVFRTPLARVWIDYSKGGFRPETEVEPEWSITDYDVDPFINLIKANAWPLPKEIKIGYHQGSVVMLERMKTFVGMVAIPNDILPARSVYVKEGAKRYHYYEYCNLDELRRNPPASIHTSAPITAAMAGIDLRRRERRPKSLPLFSYDLQLTPERLELAVENTKAIREALDEGLHNTSLT